jgi:competence protein ComEC
LDPETEEALRATGTVHLAVISGLHVGWVAALAFGAARFLWARLPPFAERWPAQWAGAGAALLVASAYAGLAGFSLPTQRALLMAVVGLGAWLVGRPSGLPRALALAAWAVLIWRPDHLHEAGFWLSFGAVAAIALTLRGGWGEGGRLRRAVAIQLAVTLALAPLLLFWFGRAAPLSPIANAGALPIFGFVAVPGTLAGTVLYLTGLEAAGGGLLAAVGEVLHYTVALLSALAEWDPGWQAPRPGRAGLLVMMLGMAAVLGWRGRGRWVGVPLLAAPLLAAGPPALPEGRARVWVLDVGQGSATVVETARHVLVVDCGPRFGPGFNAGSAMVAPFLRTRGWPAVDRLVVSHGDEDHNGGCAGLRSAMPVKQGPASASAPASVRRWRWDGVTFSTWSAPDLEGNNGSRVVRVVAGGDSLLLPGDVEEKGERRLLQGPLAVEADVVAAPHHGSGSSSTPAFVEAVDPGWVAVSVGHRNRWGFPDAEVLARYRRQGARVLRTDRRGALRIGLGGGVEVQGYRAVADRYWNARTHRRLR